MSKRNVVHVEIPAVNPEAAGKFYQELFGWKLQHDHELNYSMWEDGTGSGGGFPAVSEETPDWLSRPSRWSAPNLGA